MPLRDIPIGSKVSKKTGDKIYTIRDQIKIYGGQDLTKEIKVSEGTRFLVAENGDIQVVDGNLEFLWHVEYHTLFSFLDMKINYSHPQ